MESIFKEMNGKHFQRNEWIAFSKKSMDSIFKEMNGEHFQRNEWKAFSKKLLNELATLHSSEMISSFSTNVICGKVVTLLDKNGFTVFRNFLLSVTLFKSSLS